MKAFDRVSHELLVACLERFGFEPNFISDVSSSVKTNGGLTAFIKLERGLRQDGVLTAVKLQKINKIIAAWCRRELSPKRKSARD